MKKHIAEAYRYIDNAKEIIKTKLKVDERGFYNDPKYVRMAGRTAYAGVLVALEPFVLKKKGTRLSVTDYHEAIAKRDKTVNTLFQSVYNYLSLLAGYDGELSKKTLSIGLDYAKKLIEWADNHSTSLGGVKQQKTRKRV